jgi:rubredoxin
VSAVAHIPDRYTCEECGETYDKSWSDEEAAAEAVENFGDLPNHTNMAIVCDDCFNRLMGRS